MKKKIPSPENTTAAPKANPFSARFRITNGMNAAGKANKYK